MRGPIVFRGYHRAPQATAQALDSQGWLHTGDVGEWLPGGRLRLIDRCAQASLQLPHCVAFYVACMLFMMLV